ncbi:MAG: hypothetical protein LBW85_11750 [Deltaproteobacteria bacterium]|jgi:His-Xaa-Ser system protein HxsD|nr:hypothetical protein [Deltaproteobacteria bacterium]
MKGITMQEEDGERLILSKEYFEKEAVFAVASDFTGGYYVGIRPHGVDSIEVTLKPKDGAGDPEAAREFCNGLVEQQARLDLQKRFGGLREIIVAEAFSAIDGK